MPHRSTPPSLLRLVLAAVCAVLILPAFSHADPLPRRIMLGTQIQNTSDETRNRLGIAAAGGVEVLMVVPDSNAAAAKIRKGDVILAVGGKEFVNVAGFLELVGTLRGGTDVEIRLNREGKERTLTATLKSLPLETSDEFDTEYSFVDSPAGRLRTVLTVPRNATSSRAILLLSGLGNAAAEHPVADPIGFRAIATALTRQGFAVLRVDKPGCGDSEGGPARDATFDAIVKGYAAGVRLLKSDKRIDATQVYLFGVSIGGLQAPLVAQQEPVAGIALFGTAGTNWPEYLQENSRRQLAFSGIGPGQIEQEVAQISAGWKALVDEKLTPDEIADRHPELGEWVEQNWGRTSSHPPPTTKSSRRSPTRSSPAAGHFARSPVSITICRPRRRLKTRFAIPNSQECLRLLPSPNAWSNG
ncbi:MAG: alpha/beta fold hydrolase [Planctomycetota bacterium]|nr:alpha/beta fold hydrolase [Planctomycetota bacterium]